MVTIVILIILATISVNLILNGGLVSRIQSGKKLHELEKERERLELIKPDVASNTNHIGRVTVDTYIEELIHQGITEAEEVEDNGNGSKTVITDTGYSVIIEPNGENDVKIIIEGKAGELPPIIKEVNLTRNSNHIVIEVTARRTKGATYNYYKKVGTDWVVLKEKSSDVTAIWTGTNTTSDYTIKVVVENEYGSDSKEETSYGIKAGDVVDKPSTWDSDKVTAVSDGKGGVIPLPDGYYYVGGDIDKGFVISDKEGDTLTASGINMGSQFVWIPVANESILTRTNFNTSTGQPTGELETKYAEPYAGGYAGETTEYNTMRTQVLKYGGFYIGRYEAGINSTTLRTKATTAQTVVVKKGVAPYNYMPWGKSMSDASEMDGKSGAVYLAKNMYTHPDSMTSTLCYGCQWDAMCRYIGNSQRKENKKSAVGLTGSVSSDVSKNIYDLAGNCYEKTMEAGSSTTRVRRGGYYSTANEPVSFRGATIPNNAYGEPAGFRCSLYIK